MPAQQHPNGDALRLMSLQCSLQRRALATDLGALSYYNNIHCNWKRSCPRQLGILASLIRPTTGRLISRLCECPGVLGWPSPAAPGSLGASEAAGAGADAGVRCKQLLLWECLIAALQMGLEKARVPARTRWLRGPSRGPWQAGKQETGPREH